MVLSDHRKASSEMLQLITRVRCMKQGDDHSAYYRDYTGNEIVVLIYIFFICINTVIRIAYQSSRYYYHLSLKGTIKQNSWLLLRALGRDAGGPAKTEMKFNPFASST